MTNQKEEPKKKYRVVIERQWREFDTQDEAKKMAKAILETGYLYYMILENAP